MKSAYYLRLPLADKPRPLSEGSMRRALLGSDYWAAHPDRIPSTLSYRQRILDYVAKIQRVEARGVGIYFYGPLGSGKTAAAAIILKAAMARGASGLFYTATEMQRALNRFGATAPNGCPIEEALRCVHFLVVDELGGEDDAKWKLPDTEMVLRARQRDRLPTIITSNVEPSAVRWPWLKSLTSKSYVPVLVAGHNWREAPPPSTKGTSSGPHA